jgi:hypothetical protein
MFWLKEPVLQQMAWFVQGNGRGSGCRTLTLEPSPFCFFFFCADGPAGGRLLLGPAAAAASPPLPPAAAAPAAAGSV